MIKRRSFWLDFQRQRISRRRLLGAASMGAAGLVVVAACGSGGEGSEAGETPVVEPGLDHLVYATPDLDAAVARLAELLGVRATSGGQHPGLGTHNALLSLGEGAYLEIIALDPTQPQADGPLVFGLDTLTQPRLVTWAVKAPDIDSRVEKARAVGYELGGVVPSSRELPDGTRLEWQLTIAGFFSHFESAGDGLVPFLIDWGSTRHPSQSAAPGTTLLSLRGEHPRPGSIRPLLEAMEVELALAEGPSPALIATLQTPEGKVELR